MGSKNAGDSTSKPGSNVKRYQALDEVRNRIDQIDTLLAPLLAERLALANDVAAVKAELGLAIKDTGREQEVLRKVADASSDANLSEAIRDIYQEIIRCSRAVQARSAAQTKLDTVYFPQVTIIGMGLIGGVMARLIKANVPETRIVGIDLDADALNSALSQGLIDSAESDLKKAINRSSLIILAASPDANLKLLDDLALLLRKRQLLIDVTSVKSTIVDAADRLKLAADFIGGHPLFGNERVGLAGSQSVKTDGAVFCLTPGSRSSEISVRRLVRWLSALGLKVEVVDATAHDKIVARTSHVVQLLTIALGSELADLADECGLERVVTLCGPSVKQLSRLMNSPAQLWAQISSQNQHEIAESARALSAQLLVLAEAVESGDHATLIQAFDKAKKMGKSLNDWQPS